MLKLIEGSNNKKFNGLIETGYRLFMQYGIKRITINEICQAAKVSRVTFYKYFNNKIELLKSIIESIANRQLNAYKQIMEQKVTFPEKVQQIIRLKNDYTIMMSQDFFNDLWNSKEQEIIDLLIEAKKNSFQAVLNDFKTAQKNGDIRQDINLNFILFFLEHLTELAKDENLIKLYHSPNELIVELTNFFFYGILPRQKMGGKHR